MARGLQTSPSKSWSRPLHEVSGRYGHCVTSALRERGHDAIHLQEQGLGRMIDGDILEKARIEERILLTHDLEFGELLAASKGNLPSVVIFRLKDMRANNVMRYLSGLIEKHSSALEKGVVCSVSERKIRIRALPI